MIKNNSPDITPKEALVKAARFCAYQERYQQEVRDKLYSYGLTTTEVEEVLTKLILENFINEERYAKAFSSGKFRLKKWGRGKIENELSRKGLTSYCIQKGLDEIDMSEYMATLRALMEKKIASIRSDVPLKIKNKTFHFLFGKGYEPDLIAEAWNLTEYNV